MKKYKELIALKKSKLVSNTQNFIRKYEKLEFIMSKFSNAYL